MWALALSPDKRYVVSTSADHTVKFWEFELVDPSAEERTGGGDQGRKFVSIKVECG